MRWLASLLLVVGLACSTGRPAVLELSIRKEGGLVTPTDVVRLERRVLALRGVTLVSVSSSREKLIIHYGTDTAVEQIEAVLRESGFQWSVAPD